MLFVGGSAPTITGMFANSHEDPFGGYEFAIATTTKARVLPDIKVDADSRNIEERKSSHRSGKIPPRKSWRGV
jgi:hypothetical protein